MSESIESVMKRYAASNGYDGKREDAYAIADFACRVLPKLKELLTSAAADSREGSHASAYITIQLAITSLEDAQ